MVSLAGFGLSAAINGGIALLVLSLFLWLRRKPINRFVYAPRLLHEANRQGRPAPPTLPDHWFSWLYTLVFDITNQDVLQSCGLDAYMFLRYLELCVKLFALMTVFGVGILVPVSYTIDNGVATDPFDTISLANISTDDSRLAAFILVSYVFSALTYYLVHNLYQEYHTLRHNYLAQEFVQNRHLTLRVTDIPAGVSSNKQLAAAMQARVQASLSGADGLVSDGSQSGLQDKEGNFVYSAFIATNVGELDQLVLDRDSHLNSLEQALITYQLKPEERPKTATKYLCCAKQDAITWHKENFTKCNNQIQELQKNPGAPYSNGFVTCSSVIAYQSLLSAEKRRPSQDKEFVASAASELRDVYWPSMAFTRSQRFWRGIGMSIALYLLVGFWLIPVGFVQSIANLKELSGSVPFLSFVNSIPSGLLAIIDGFLPSLVLVIFNIILPMILYKFAKVQGIMSNSALSERVITTFFLFQAFSNFIGAQITTAMAKNPSSVFSSQAATVLGSTIPATSTFFITYILLTAFAAYPLMLLNPGGIIVGKLKKKYLVKSTRDLVGVETSPSLDYGTTYPTSLFIFIIAICFALLASIILPFAVLYFSIAWFANKYMLLYVYNNPFENGGKFWPCVMRKMMYCIVISQIIFTLVLGLKQAPGPAAVSAPLILLPLIFMYWIERKYRYSAEIIPLILASRIDEVRHQLSALNDRNEQVQKQGKKLPSAAPSSTVYLDEVNCIQRVDYDAHLYRCMMQHDFQFPHEIVTPMLTHSIYHASDASDTPSSSSSASSRHSGQPENGKNEEPALEHVAVNIDSSQREQNKQHARQPSSASGLVVSAPESMQEAISQAAQGGITLAPQFDFVQQSLLAPTDLSLPERVRVLENTSLQSIELDRSIFLAQWRAEDDFNAKFAADA